MTPAESPTPKTICLVDDDTSVLKAVGRLLTSAGWVVRAFGEFALFLVLISMNRVDLVIFVICMDNMTFLEELLSVCSYLPHTWISYLKMLDGIGVDSD